MRSTADPAVRMIRTAEPQPGPGKVGFRLIADHLIADVVEIEAVDGASDDTVREAT
jgi:hypothetical protein